MSRKNSTDIMRIVLRVESNKREEVSLLVETLQEKFPHWKFDHQEFTRIVPGPDQEGQLLEFHQAEASFTRKEHVTGSL